MKVFKSNEGYVFQNKETDEILYEELYTPDDFDESVLIQITLEEAQKILEQQNELIPDEEEK